MEFGVLRLSSVIVRICVAAFSDGMKRKTSMQLPVGAWLIAYRVLLGPWNSMPKGWNSEARDVKSRSLIFCGSDEESL
jgi:hypothetical protein